MVDKGINLASKKYKIMIYYLMKKKILGKQIKKRLFLLKKQKIMFF